MWALVTELLFSFVLLAFLVISCQNVLHIASGSVRSVLTYMHVLLDRELGEIDGVDDEEENVTTRVVRRRVILKVQTEGRRTVEQKFEDRVNGQERDGHNTVWLKEAVCWRALCWYG